MIYVVQQSGRAFVKIGFTSRDVASRIAELGTGSVERIVLVLTMDGSQADEKRLHKRFARYRVRKSGEWFRLQDELAVWVAFERQRSDDQRAAERAQRDEQRRLEREAAQRQREERERLSAQERLNNTCAAVAYGRHLLRSGGFKRRLAEHHLPRLEEAARKIMAEYRLQGPDLPPQADRLARCREAWQWHQLPETAGGWTRQWAREHCPNAGCLFWLVVLAMVLFVKIATRWK